MEKDTYQWRWIWIIFMQNLLILNLNITLKALKTPTSILVTKGSTLSERKLLFWKMLQKP